MEKIEVVVVRPINNERCFTFIHKKVLQAKRMQMFDMEIFNNLTNNKSNHQILIKPSVSV